MKSIIKVVVTIFLFTNISYAHVGIDETKPASEFILNISSNSNEILFPIVTLAYINVLALDKNSSIEFLNLNNTILVSEDTAVAPEDYYWDNNNGKPKRFIRGEQGNQYVGELYGGGILFYIYENKGGSNGLIG